MQFEWHEFQASLVVRETGGNSPYSSSFEEFEAPQAPKQPLVRWWSFVCFYWRQQRGFAYRVQIYSQAYHQFAAGFTPNSLFEQLELHTTEAYLLNVQQRARKIVRPAQVEKSPNDPRSYRAISLPSGMKV